MIEHEQPTGGKVRKNLFFLLATLTILAIVGYAIVTSQDADWQTKDAPPASIKAQLTLTSTPNLNYANVKFDEITLKTTTTTGLTIQDNDLDTTSADITIKNYQGKLSTDGTTISLDGTAENIYINNVGIKNQENMVKIKAITTPFEQLTIPTTRLTKIEYKTSGDVKLADGRITFTLADEPVTIKNYEGKIVVGNSFILEGTLGSIGIQGLNIQG